MGELTRGMSQLGLALGGAAAGLVLAGWGVAMLWLPVWLAGDGVAARGVAMALLLWLSVTGLAFGLGAGAWVGWRLSDRVLGPEHTVPPAVCCQHCGYDLTGSVSQACPECGQAIEPEQRRAIEARGVRVEV